MNNPYRTTFHRDGTITFWDIFQQTWRRLAAADISDHILASMPARERKRIDRMVKQAVNA